MTIGEKINFFRKRKKLSQEQMAEKLSMTPQGYGKIERNETDVSYSRLLVIAKTLEISLANLIGYGEVDLSVHNNMATNNSTVMGNHSTLYNYTDRELVHELELLKIQVAFLTQQVTDKDTQLADKEVIIKLLQGEKK